jgi:glycosyltransferase involved in cell wall biosynthesis
MNKQLTIAFHVYNFSYRGTEISLYDYADKNETILKNKSFIVAPKSKDDRNNVDVIIKFTNRFNIFLYKDYDDLKNILKNQKANALYIIKSGEKDQLSDNLTNSIPLLIHCVYRVSDPHGLIYAGVSEEVVKNSKFDFVPHMTTLCSYSEKKLNNKMIDLRTILKIPKKAIVFGRHGGIDTFNLPNLKELILKILTDDENIHFMFMPKPYILYNTNHPRIHYFQISIDPLIKISFINSCDAMIHCQQLGESFGLSVLEFSSMNKPVITWSQGIMRQHLLNLGDKGILYNTMEDLYKILINFKRKDYNKGENYWNVTTKFIDVNVMEKFNNIFLKYLF